MSITVGVPDAGLRVQTLCHRVYPGFVAGRIEAVPISGFQTRTCAMMNPETLKQ
jgi:hypothetical protein